VYLFCLHPVQLVLLHRRCPACISSVLHLSVPHGEVWQLRRFVQQMVKLLETADARKAAASMVTDVIAFDRTRKVRRPLVPPSRGVSCALDGAFRQLTDAAAAVAQKRMTSALLQYLRVPPARGDDGCSSFTRWSEEIAAS